MRKFVLILMMALLLAGCASRQELKENCFISKNLYVDIPNPKMDDVNSTLNYCRHAIDANPDDPELIKAYNEMYLRFYNEDGTPK
ncbi:MAG: hypothetical protein AB7D39_03540 [Pseudodesulfovibrio sp.]|uniref:hypothetical protein n=1 Tax=Pseudodesulfovibrio sp. TaxID=2035812 RepID=UPI003D0AEB26